MPSTPTKTKIVKLKNAWSRTPGTSSFAEHDDLVLYSTQSGWSTPGWRKRIKAGLNASSPYTCDKFAVEVADPMSFVLVSKYRQSVNPDRYTPLVEYRYKGFPNSLGNFLHNAEPSPEQASQALSKFLSNIRQTRSEMNGLTVLGELRETLHMLRHPAEALRKATERYIQAVKSKGKKVNQRTKRRRRESEEDFRVRRANALKDAVSGSWLEYKFGALPLLSDIQDIGRVAERLLDEERRTTVKGRSKELRVKLNANPIHQSDVEGVVFTGSRSWSTTVSVQYQGGLRLKQSGASGISRLAELSGFTLENFVPAAWELAPWSFLADYFVNIGEVLEASSTDTSGLFWATRTTRQVTTCEDTMFASLGKEALPGLVGYCPLAVEGKCYATRRVKRVTIQRLDVLGNLGSVALSFTFPGERSGKWFNMAALLAQQAKLKR
jgi:hypothetical protein